MSPTEPARARATGPWDDDPVACGAARAGATAPTSSSPPRFAQPAGEIDGLVDRMRRGDRDAAAVFITTYGSRLRRRIRGKLSPAMRRVFDSQEILSTVGRRLDAYVKTGRLDSATANQFWALILRIADNALVDKARVFRRLERTEGEDSEIARELLRRFKSAQRRHTSGFEVEIEKALRLLGDETDRDILMMWLTGARHHEIAESIEMTPCGVRKRWQTIRTRLRERLGES